MSVILAEARKPRGWLAINKMFREHSFAMKGIKKGNMDADVIFSTMERMYKKTKFDKVVLVSGDVIAKS